MRAFGRESNALQHRDGAENIATMAALIAANRLQDQKRKDPPFKEPVRARAIGLLSATFPAVKFLKEPLQRRCN